MKIIITVCLSVFISLVSISLAEDAENQKNTERLTMKTVEIKAKEIDSNLVRFHKEKDVQIIEQIIGSLTSLRKLDKLNVDEWLTEWPNARRIQAELWFKLHEAVEKEIDKNFDFTSSPQRNISAPGSYPSGVAPESIKEPELRKEYEKALAENKKKIDEHNFQYRLRKLEEDISYKLECFLVEVYSQPPEAIDELQKIMDTYKMNEETKSRMLKKLSK
ncbi:MAG: hypothetical protein PHP98_03415 [Kiritimatiellae bacterium]|nr:hypothetical protein [Kiritimatiellia bacterium]